MQPDRALTDGQKERVIARLLAIWKENPELRLGQLILNVHDNLYYVEDEVFISNIEFFYESLKRQGKWKP